jgi:hypothetical protein
MLSRLANLTEEELARLQGDLRMSHFSLIVALPPGSDVDQELSERLAPYDENKDVDAHPDYEIGTAENFWWYGSLKSDAETVANNDHSQIRPYEPDGIGISSSFSHKTPEEQWEDFVRDAELYATLPQPITWEALVAAHNDYYCDGHPFTDGSRMYYEAETDRAYTLSTYNPDSKWDYYRIGGRWARYFPLRSGASRFHSGVISTPLSWEWKDTPADQIPARASYVEGGPKFLLDLDRLRDEKEKEAAKDYDEFHEFAKDYPKAQGWQSLVDETDAIPGKERGAAIERCRQVYRAQPLVQAMKEDPRYRSSWSSPIDTYSGNREDFLAKARREAVPGYALLTLDKEWAAAGEMGWFGLGSDTDDSTKEYKEFANEYLDNLDDDVILVVLDLHI